MIKGKEGDINIYVRIGKIRKYGKYFYADILEKLRTNGKFHEMEIGYSRPSRV